MLHNDFVTSFCHGWDPYPFPSPLSCPIGPIPCLHRSKFAMVLYQNAFKNAFFNWVQSKLQNCTCLSLSQCLSSPRWGMNFPETQCVICKTHGILNLPPSLSFSSAISINIIIMKVHLLCFLAFYCFYCWSYIQFLPFDLWPEWWLAVTLSSVSNWIGCYV